MTAIVALLTVVIGLRAVATSGAEQRMGRAPFLRFWLLAWLPVWFVVLQDVMAFADFMSSSSEQFTNLLFFYYLVAVHPITQRVMWRANDAGMSKWVAYLTLVPAINLLAFLFLGTVSSKPDTNEPSQLGEV